MVIEEMRGIRKSALLGIVETETIMNVLERSAVAHAVEADTRSLISTTSIESRVEDTPRTAEAHTVQNQESVVVLMKSAKRETKGKEMRLWIPKSWLGDKKKPSRNN
jgi:hypothetical protein